MLKPCNRKAVTLLLAEGNCQIRRRREHLLFSSPLSTPCISMAVTLFQLPSVKFSNFSSQKQSLTLIQVLRDKTFRKHAFFVGNVVL